MGRIGSDGGEKRDGRRWYAARALPACATGRDIVGRGTG